MSTAAASTGRAGDAATASNAVATVTTATSTSVALPMAAEPLRSRSFAPEFDVLSGYRAHYPQTVFPVVEFGSDFWDFSHVPRRPAHLTAGLLTTDFSSILEAELRLAAKELTAALLCPQHPRVREVINRRARPLPIGVVYQRTVALRTFFRWMSEHGLHSLSEVEQEHCDAFLLLQRERGLIPNSVRPFVWLLREFADYRPVLTSTYREGFRPWKHVRASRIVGYSASSSQNRTPWVPDDVFEAVLAGALFLVQTAAPDILAAHQEILSLQVAPKLPKGCAAADARLRELLADYRAVQRPLPRRPDSTRQPASRLENGVLQPLNLSLLGKRIGVALAHTTLSPTRRALLEAAVAELGIADGGLDAEPAEVQRPDGSRGPWRQPFDPMRVDEDVRLLVTAAFVVIAGLSGMRSSEILELRRGCVERVDLGDGQTRLRLRSRLVKDRGHGGDEETWTVVAEVVEAVAVLEALTPEGAPADALLLCTGLVWGRLGGERPNLTKWMTRLCAWQNEHGAMAGLPKIPEAGGRPWLLNARQLRRTLARQLAFRPHGTIASKIHLKHVSATVSEGYWGPPGESAAAFLAEVEADEREARVEAIARRYHQWQAGEAPTGGGSKRLLEDFRVVESQLEDFKGTVDQADRRLRLLLRSRANTMHVGLLNDCHFTDPLQSRCLSKRGIVDADAPAPMISVCEPSKCANAVITREHLPQWELPMAQIEDLLGDRKVPAFERERLRRERDRIQSLIAPLQEAELQEAELQETKLQASNTPLPETTP